ncbi:MAG: 50S ribosomal protein L3 [archaeon]
MPKAHTPRSGSMQYWPHKRAKRIYPRIRSFSGQKGLLGFPAYKAGMTHVMGVDARKASRTKGETINVPVTVLECPPIRIAAVRFYKRKENILCAEKDYYFKAEKELSRKTNLPKTPQEAGVLDSINPDEYENITVLAYTQPKLAGIGKKTPEVIELHIGGGNKDRLAFVKEHLAKDILFTDVFAEGDYADARSITKGKGLQGPVRRFGIDLKQHKSEKGVRRPGSLGGWRGQGHVMYRVAMAGQMGFHQRTEYNKQVYKILKPEEATPKGAFIRYGVVRAQAALIRGSLAGSKKRMIVLTKAQRLKAAQPVPTIDYISQASQQGV